MKVSYATHADVLYVVFQDTANKCVYVELDSGVICRVDEANDKVVGITIPDFLRRSAARDAITIPELIEGISSQEIIPGYGGPSMNYRDDLS